MPKAIGYGPKKKKRRKPPHGRLMISKAFKGRKHKAEKGTGLPPRRKRRMKGTARPVTGLRRFKKKRRTLKK